MKSYWRVTKVTETEAGVLADLEAVEWFKRNPEHTAQMERYASIQDNEGFEAADNQSKDWPEVDEFIDATPGEEAAEFIEGRGNLTLDISEEGTPDLHAGDNVLLEVAVIVVPEEVDA